MSKKIAFITYETPFAPCGGIAAVMARLPGHVKDVSGLDSIVITPYHHQISKTTSLNMAPVGNFGSTFNKQPIVMTVRRYDDSRCSWYFLDPNNPQFFAGTPHPFRLGQADLLRDSILFGRSIHDALNIIDPQVEWILMMQDWEAATTVLDLASRGKHSNYKLFVTLHNSYDSGVTDSYLSHVGINNPSQCPGETILQRVIPLVQNPVFTVSEQFALDLVEDDFQSCVMAPHLKELLRPKLLGVNNGPFTDLAFDTSILEQARQGDFKPLHEWKSINRKEALKALDKLIPSDDKPVWGDRREFDRDDSACWFVMAGRDDARQKGYDVAAAGVESFLRKPANQEWNARFFFFPIPGDEGLEGLDFLKKLANSFPQEVLVLPFIWQEGFFATLQGANYGIMPSLYEPFGMANEFYLKGAVGIGRATGGILHQIVPLRAALSFSHAAEIRALHHHCESAHPTGILFRERDYIVSSIDDWRGINKAEYDIPGGTLRSLNRVQQRNQYALFQAMVHELELSITDAVNVYFSSQNATLYYRMLTEGIDFVRNTLSWERAAQEYVRNAL